MYQKKSLKAFTCEFCQKPFKNVHPASKFCTRRCKQAFYREPKSKRGKGATGAMNELFVCADLMDKGYQVFRAQSPDASCDLLVMDGKKIWRVEVTTGRYLKQGIYYPGHKDKSKYDWLAIVLSDHKIIYKRIEA